MTKFKRIFILILVLILSNLFLLNCARTKKKEAASAKTGKKYSGMNYFISLNYPLPGWGQCDSLADFLSHTIGDSVFVFDERTKNLKPHLRIGFYKTKFEAGQRAFRLFSDSLITEYSICDSTGKVYDAFADFPFIGKYLNRPALYNFNLITKKTKLIWGQWGRKILSSIFNYKRDAAYLTTALTYGQQGSFPFLTDGRVYFFLKENRQLKLIKKFHNGNQLYLIRTNEDTVKAVFTHIDSLYSNSFIRDEYLFKDGKEISGGNQKIFELLKDGFPGYEKEPLNVYSHDKMLGIFTEEENNKKLYLLLNRKNRKEYRLFDSELLPVGIEWSEDDSVSLIALKSEKPDSAGVSLYIIDNQSAVTISSIQVEDEANYILYGNLLVYDKGFGEKSQIIFYNFRNGKIIYNLTLKGGCGINNLRTGEE